MSRKLITEYMDPTATAVEQKDGNLYINGIFASVGQKNKNGRTYKKETLEREINKLSESVGKCLWGELNHPQSPDINLERAAILIESLKWDGDNVIGRAKVLKTPMGRIAETLIKEGATGISSRGLGTVDPDGYVNNDSYQLLTFDLVSNPSNHPSWVNGVYEGATFADASNTVEKKEEISESEAKKAYKNYLLSELKKLLS